MYVLYLSFFYTIFLYYVSIPLCFHLYLIVSVFLFSSSPKAMDFYRNFSFLYYTVNRLAICFMNDIILSTDVKSTFYSDKYIFLSLPLPFLICFTNNSIPIHLHNHTNNFVQWTVYTKSQTFSREIMPSVIQNFRLLGK